MPDEVADAIREYCYQVTPAAYHDVSRHVKGRARPSDRALPFIESYGPTPIDG